MSILQSIKKVLEESEEKFEQDIQSLRLGKKNKTKKENMKKIRVAVSVLFALVIVATAWAGQGLVQDRRVSMEQAQRWAAQIQSEIPIVINSRVLAQLNRFLGTPDGRTYVRDTLERMKAYEERIGQKIAATATSAGCVWI
jgi:hypothetical protein